MGVLINVIPRGTGPVSIGRTKPRYHNLSTDLLAKGTGGAGGSSPESMVSILSVH